MIAWQIASKLLIGLHYSAVVVDTEKVLKKNDGVSSIFLHKKAVPERHASESRQECENKRKVGENTLSQQLFLLFKIFRPYILKVDEMN